MSTCCILWHNSDMFWPQQINKAMCNNFRDSFPLLFLNVKLQIRLLHFLKYNFLQFLLCIGNLSFEYTLYRIRLQLALWPLESVQTADSRRSSSLKSPLTGVQKEAGSREYCSLFQETCFQNALCTLFFLS